MHPLPCYCCLISSGVLDFGKVKTQEEELEEQEQIRKKTEKLAEEYQVLAQEYARNQALRQVGFRDFLLSLPHESK